MLKKHPLNNTAALGGDVVIASTLLDDLSAEVLWNHLTTGGTGDAEVSCGLAETVLCIDPDDLVPGSPVPNMVRSELEALLQVERGRASALSVNGRIAVHRAVHIPHDVLNDWLERLTDEGGGLGVCWADHPNGAIAYGGSAGGCKVVISGTVELNAIDWPTTILVDAFQQEGELRLLPDAMVRITGVTGPRGPLPSPILGQDHPVSVSEVLADQAEDPDSAPAP